MFPELNVILGLRYYLIWRSNARQFQSTIYQKEWFRSLNENGDIYYFSEQHHSSPDPEKENVALTSLCFRRLMNALLCGEWEHVIQKNDRLRSVERLYVCYNSNNMQNIFRLTETQANVKN